MNRIKAYQQEQHEDAVKQRAASGDASAQYEMARLLLSSNPAESFEWLQRAGNQGHAGAQASLGQMYTHDQYFSSFNAYGTIPPADIPQDYTKAVNWFLKAAVQGDSYSQRRLGDLYKYGEGVPRSREQAAACIPMRLGGAIAQHSGCSATCIALGLGCLRTILTRHFGTRERLRILIIPGY